MGSPESEPGHIEDEEPQHEVSVPSFFMGAFVITKRQYRAVEKTEYNLFEPSLANFPVTNQSWLSAKLFCNNLSKLTGRTYRLPSESEWEYACRAGTSTPFSFGATLTSEIADFKNTNSHSKISYYNPSWHKVNHCKDVNQFLPNGFGLYNMHGQIGEWCADTYHSHYEGAPQDGSAWHYSPSNYNDSKVIRGGSNEVYPEKCRSASRRSLPGVPEKFRYLFRVGFRVVCELPS